MLAQIIMSDATTPVTTQASLEQYHSAQSITKDQCELYTYEGKITGRYWLHSVSLTDTVNTSAVDIRLVVL